MELPKSFSGRGTISTPQPLRDIQAGWRRATGPEGRLNSPADWNSSMYTVFGVPWQRLSEARDRLHECHAEPSFVAHYIIFSCGLTFALSFMSIHDEVPEHLADDGLPEIARENLEYAIDLCLDDITEEVINQNPKLYEYNPKLFGLLATFGILESQPPPAVKAWIARGNKKDNLLRLFFAMGVRSASDTYARRTIESIMERPMFFAPEEFAEEAQELVLSFTCEPDWGEETDWND
jgi:hypothetical protein